MTGNIFEIRKDIPEITAEGLSIPEFKAIWNSDESDSKVDAKGIFAYIYHTVDPQSVYKNLNDREKHKTLVVDYVKKAGWKPDKDVKKAIKKYERLIETPELRLVRSSKRLLDKMADYFNQVDFTELNPETGLPVYDPKKLVDTIKQLSSVARSIDELEEAVARGEASKSEKLRGNTEFNIFEEDYDN